MNFDHHLHPNPVAMSNTTNTNTTDAAIHALTVQLATELGLSPDLGLAALYAERDRRNRAAEAAAEKKRKREEAEKKKRAEVARVPAR